MITFVASCVSKDTSQADKALVQVIDSLRLEIKQLHKAEKTVIYDTIKIVRVIEAAPKKAQIKKSDTLKRIKKTMVEPATQPVKVENDTVKYYYKNAKKLSVVITPWAEGRRKVIFYNPAGYITYTEEDVRLSYHSTTTLHSFHDNGAVSKINIHFNPGASLYMYDTDITFDIDNEPLWRSQRQWPQEKLEINLPDYWDKNKKVWVKQESQPGLLITE